ncbi:dicarboxylate/amino acid:cation symporter [Clostridium sp. D2Q-11]|uniref:Dicarboxylate/amino acid:cation symporter n=1 Tax=Anaeromonas frigoriresistens TaxID=2683708 RepID=A0A942Z896_9FIRM|nr:dicarboxylate/amino acid:cation symporter [Anaeromonas frigoriresistens]MBS4537744.1 dicarboxylate/amino acid:cation symporter [Anaeromonas frigoriresistens]
MQKKLGLLPKLIIGIILGIIIGLISKQIEMYVVVRFLSTFSSFFGNFLNFIIPFVIIAFVAPGIADLGRGAGKLLGITALFAYISAVVAGIMAFFIGSAILPHVIKVGELASGASVNVDPYFEITIDPMMGVMTALITAFILGLGMAYIKQQRLFGVLEDFQSIIQGVVKYFLIPFIPLHIAGIFAKITATGEIFNTIKTFSSVFAMIIILQLSYIIIQYLIAFFYTGKNPIKSIKNMLPAYFTALGTQSSAATIPVTIESTRKNEVEEDIIDFVIPLGATIHLAGDTITLVLASMGVMLMHGNEPTLAVMVPFILMLGVTMVAAPGIPGGGVMAALGLIETMLGFGPAKQALMIALHFAQDSFGTATNVTGDGAIAIIMDKVAKRKVNK